MYSLLCTVFSILFTVRHVPCTMYCVQCTVYSVLCIVHRVQCMVYSVQCTVYNVLCTVHRVQCTVNSEQCTLMAGVPELSAFLPSHAFHQVEPQEQTDGQVHLQVPVHVLAHHHPRLPQHRHSGARHFHRFLHQNLEQHHQQHHKTCLIRRPSTTTSLSGWTTSRTSPTSSSSLSSP